MIQARGLWADRKSGLALMFLLLVSILCMITGELASGGVDPAETEGIFAAAQQTDEWVLPGEQPAIEAAEDSVSVDGEDAFASNCASALLWKSTSPKLSRTAALLAGFLFMGKFLLLCAGGNLPAFLHWETPGRARFLRELFIQKKKDGKKRCIFLTAE